MTFKVGALFVTCYVVRAACKGGVKKHKSLTGGGFKLRHESAATLRAFPCILIDGEESNNLPGEFLLHVIAVGSLSLAR